MCKISYSVGDKIGECTYLGEAYSKNWVRFGNFKCKCGEIFISSISKVKSLHTRSCGCLVSEKVIKLNKTHGMTNSPEYNSWVNLIQRCTNPNNKRFPEWGGRGIKVCDRWLNSFENFYEDMGNKPSQFHSVDRYPDNNGIYEQGNARWATTKEQALNRRSNLMVEYKGDLQPLKKLTERYDLTYSVIYQRIKKLGWSVEKAFEQSKRYKNA